MQNKPINSAMCSESDTSHLGEVALTAHTAACAQLSLIIRRNATISYKAYMLNSLDLEHNQHEKAPLGGHCCRCSNSDLISLLYLALISSKTSYSYWETQLCGYLHSEHMIFFSISGPCLAHPHREGQPGQRTKTAPGLCSDWGLVDRNGVGGLTAYCTPSSHNPWYSPN